MLISCSSNLHGDKTQKEREKILDDFKKAKRNILVATDVASRGLEIDNIKVVINYDFSHCIEDYVHRIGRTGRKGRTGLSFTFFTEEDSPHAADLVHILKQCDKEIPHVLAILADSCYSRKPKHGKGYDTADQATDFWKRAIPGFEQEGKRPKHPLVPHENLNLKKPGDDAPQLNAANLLERLKNIKLDPFAQGGIAAPKPYVPPNDNDYTPENVSKMPPKSNTGMIGIGGGGESRYKRLAEKQGSYPNFVQESFKTFDNENYLVANTPVSLKFAKSPAFGAIKPNPDELEAVPKQARPAPMKIPILLE